uniref:G protein-coupled receptor kinase n=1 Tax=Astyanax mexicanus TaxID=7994 RepID=A0A8B9JEM4_ASTMX
MYDMGGLENLVANTAYLKAQAAIEDKELKRRRQSRPLPKLEQCTTIRSTIAMDFEQICERQPIGNKLFRQFLQASEYVVAAELLDELNDWALAEAGAKDKARQNIINKFCRSDSSSFLSYLTGDMASKCQAVSEKDFEEVMMGRVKDATQEFLRGKPFTEYQSSLFFDRFLQWKEFEKQPISEKYFYEFRTLGKGGFGEVSVCAVQVKSTGQMYACKKLDKKRLKKKGGEKMALLEKCILEKVNSRFVVNLAYAYSTKTHLCLVMSLMTGGELKYHIYHMGERGIELDRVVYYTAQITAGLLHLHAMDIVYRDMKPENVLLDSQGQCKLSDLGLAVELPGGKTICQRAGTNGYMAPEILKGESYGMSVDWWALGCSIYEMVAGRLPFKDYKEKVQKEKVAQRTLEDEFCSVLFDLVLGGQDPRKHEFFSAISFPRLEAGLITPPWVPKPNVVYAKDTEDIRNFSEVKGVEFDANDEKFFKEFSTGAVPIPWQQEMIDSGLFDELNDPNRKELSREMNDRKFSKSCTIL